MSAVLTAAASPGSGLAHVLASWRSMTLAELGWFSLMGLLYGLIDLSSLAYIEDDKQWWLALTRQLFSPAIVTLLLMLFWLPAARSDPDHPQRAWRLGLATLVGSMLALLVLWGLVRALDWPSVNELMRQRKGEIKHAPMLWSRFLGDGLSAFIPCGLTVALFEMQERRGRAQARLQRMLHEQSVMARQAMAARLAAMQAQVEPQFLFETLVDVEQAYDRADPEAATQMERLIRHLRVALPRLREAGGSLESEAELLDSYLAVVAGRSKALVYFSAQWPESLNGCALPPMLLLPLLQRALRLADGLPGRCNLAAEALPRGGLRLQLAFDKPGLCGDDEELRALAERVRALSGGPARLICRSSEDATLFTLELNP